MLGDLRKRGLWRLEGIKGWKVTGIGRGRTEGVEGTRSADHPFHRVRWDEWRETGKGLEGDAWNS